MGAGTYRFKSYRSEDSRQLKHHHSHRVMPQLIPFYFMHLLTVGIIGFSIALYLNATVTLPAILKRKLVRQTIVKG